MFESELNRRRFLGVVGSASVIGIAGCSSDSGGNGSEDGCQTQGECTEEFAQTVLSELEESGNTPKPIDGGYYVTEEGEEKTGWALVHAAFDLTNESTLGEQIGNMVFGPVYENWPDYPETEEFHFAVFPTTDAEEHRTLMHVKKWWIEAVRDGDMTTDEVGTNIVDTSTQPINEVVSN